MSFSIACTGEMIAVLRQRAKRDLLCVKAGWDKPPAWLVKRALMIGGEKNFTFDIQVEVLRPNLTLGLQQNS
jgi:hypothetical protein